MDLYSKKQLVGKAMKCSPKRVIFNPERIEEISKAITKADARSLVNDNAIVIKHRRGVSRYRARIRTIQKRKGRRTGHGSRKGRATARLPQKESWMAKIRIQRRFLRELKAKGLINNQVYRELYLKAKGGFFRSRNHIKIYLGEHDLVKRSEFSPKQQTQNKERVQ